MPDEGRGGGDDGFGARNAHAPEEEEGEFADGPLEPAPVIEQLDESDEEYDWRDYIDDEPAELESILVKQEGSALSRETEERRSEEGNEVEDVVAGFRPQDEEGEDELREHADDDRVPVHGGAVVRGGVEEGDEDCEAEEADCPVGVRVVGGFGTGECADEDDGDCAQGAEPEAEFFGDEAYGEHAGVVPDEANGFLGGAY